MKKWPVLLYMLVFPIMAWGQGFSYPVIPDSIVDRTGRINYMAAHFWNEKTIADTMNFQSPKLLLDYLYLLMQSDEKEKEKFAHSFVSLSCKLENTFRQILFWLDNILYDSSSPYYDEQLYLKLMNEVLASEADSVMKLLPKQRAEIIKKNQVGELANNFSFIDKESNHHELYDLEAPLLLLIFNNPDCSLCHRTEEEIAQNKGLQTLLDSGKVKVLAITPDADYNDWIVHDYPSNWLVGYDKEKIIYEQRLYDIQRLPCIYLLDKDKRVLLKEADYERLCKFMMKISPFPDN